MTQLPPSVAAQIESDAEEFALHHCNFDNRNEKYKYYEWAYSKGATAQALKANVLVEALEKIRNRIYNGSLVGHQQEVHDATMEIETALKQYNETL